MCHFARLLFCCAICVVALFTTPSNAQIVDYEFELNQHVYSETFGSPNRIEGSGLIQDTNQRTFTQSTSSLSGKSFSSATSDGFATNFLQPSQPNSYSTSSVQSSLLWNLDSGIGYVFWNGAAQNSSESNSFTRAESYAFGSGSFTLKADLGENMFDVQVIKSVVSNNPLTPSFTTNEIVEVYGELFINILSRAEAGRDAVPASYNNGMGSFAMLYSIAGNALPGTNPANPLPAGPIHPNPAVISGILDTHFDEDGPPIATTPTHIAGINLVSTTVVPVVSGGYGQASTTYIDPALAIGYGYTLEGTNKFHTYEIPAALPQGDDMFQIIHDNIAYDLAAGQTFDFTSIDPLGVDSFLLLGIDETELVNAGNAHPPFVYGATFMEEGVAAVSSFALISGDGPGDFDHDGNVDGADFLKWQREDRTIEGLNAWQSSYGGGAPVLASNSATVPEPSTLVTLCVAACGFWAFYRTT